MSGLPWRVVAASVAGTSHVKTGAPCQDAHGWRQLPKGWLVAAVADGAGSAAQSEIGAKLAVRTAIQAIADSTLADLPGAVADPAQEDGAWQTRLTAAFRSAREAIEAEAVTRAIPARELATTLTVVCASRSMAVAAQIGDGAALLADAAGALHALARPVAGEFHNETTFLVSPDAIEKLQFSAWRGEVAQIALLTDGLQMLALHRPDGEPHAPFFAPLFHFAREAADPDQATVTLAGFLQSPRIATRADDDLTLLLAAAPASADR